MLISLGEYMIPIDTEFIRSKVKVTKVFCAKNGFRSFLGTLYHIPFISQILIGLDEDLYPFNFELSRLKVKVTVVTVVKNVFRSFYSDNLNYLSQIFHISHAGWS